MTTRLKHLVIDRVDLVDKGANPEAYILLCKRDDMAKIACPTCGTDLATVDPTCPDCGLTVDDSMHYCPGCGMDLTGPPASLVEDEETTVTVVNLRHCPSCTIGKRKEKSMSSEVITKSDLEAIQKQLADVQVENAALAKRAAESEAVAKAALDEQQRLGYIAKMRTDYPHLPINPNEDWKVLKALDSLPDDHSAAGARLRDLLAAANEVYAQSSTFKRLGHSGHGNTGHSETAYDKMHELANQMVQKGEMKTRADALAAVAREFPALYEQYQRETRVSVTTGAGE